MLKLSAWRAVLRLSWVLGIAAGCGAAWAQDTSVFLQQGELKRASRTVGALGVDLVGEKVDLYTGALKFMQTDVALPGNNALPVAVARRYDLSSRRYARGLFGDWDLEIPHLYGNYAAGGLVQPTGWVVAGTGVPLAQQQARCTNFQAPPVARTTTGTSAAWDPDQFWSGHRINVPGEIDEVLLARDAANTAAPTDGQSYPIVTKSHWQIRCLASLARGSGEGFIALSPSGTSYKFDWMVSRKAGGLSTAGGSMARQEVWILPTQVTDRFGNTVTYTYNATYPWRVSSISSSDGRTLGLSYLPDTTVDIVSSVSDGTRTWSYVYSGTGQGTTLAQVILPDASKWQFAITPLDSTPPYAISQKPGCTVSNVWSNGTLQALPSTSTITHPSGAVATYTMQWVEHGNAGISASAANPCPLALGVSADDMQTPVYPARSIVSKTISGPGLTPASWTYAWGPHNGFWYCDASCPGTKVVSVTDARGYVMRHTFGNRFESTEGQLQQLDEAWSNGTALRSTANLYRAPSAGPYPAWIGNSGRMLGSLEAQHWPLSQRTISQQGTTFTFQVTGFDAKARPTTVKRFSSLGHTRTQTTAYIDYTNKWVIGLVGSVTEQSTGAVMVANVYDAANGNLLNTSKFGRLDQSFTYNPDGTLATQADGAGHTTTFSNYKRGLPQNVLYADTRSESVVVNNIGQITRWTDAGNHATNYGYDALGRLNLITPPAGWNPTSITFEPVATAEFGLPAGHWRQTVSTGNARSITYYDGLWRARMSRRFDSANEANTRSVVLRQFDADGRTGFESYPQRDIASITSTPLGTTNTYDGVGRLTQSVADSELGPLTSSNTYAPGFQTTSTNPRGLSSTTSFQAFDDPGAAAITAVAAPLGVNLAINRNVFSEATAITRSGTFNGSPISATRNLVYDANHRLCKTIDPETGATLQDYDAANNIAWRASGLALPSLSCDRTSVPLTARLSFGYDLRNRLTSTTYGDGSPGISRTYQADGLLETIASNGSTWAYAYNSLHLPTQESLAYAGNTYTLGRNYTANGHLSQLSYPGGPLSVDYAPNALGEPTQASGYATAVLHHPNGAVSDYTLANGIVHSLKQNDRGLPEFNHDTGVMWDRYSYDANANIASITDQQESVSTRSMGYDALDRLSTANATGVWGAASYTYDPLDNLRTATVGARSSTLNYGSSDNRLSSVLTNGVSTAYGFDVRGNLAARGAQTFSFDLGNRLASSSAGGSYVYDGHGRRIKVVSTDGSTRIQVYSLGGQLLWSTRTGLGTIPATVTGYSCPQGYSLSGTGSASLCTGTTTQPATATYSCPAGYTPGGSGAGTTCTQSTTTTVAATAGYSCPGGYTLSGSNCYATTSATLSYSCTGNDSLSGSICSHTTASTTAATVTYSCTSGTLAGSLCSTTSSTAATPIYSCPSGYTLSGSTCSGSTTVPATPTLSCNGHGSLQPDESCMTVTVVTGSVADDPTPLCMTAAANYGLVYIDFNPVGTNPKMYSCILGPVTTYACPTGSLSGSQCIVPVSQAASISGYSCPSGYSLSGSSCSKTTTTAANAAYSCTAGTLSGTSCISSSTSTYAASASYSCPGGYTLSGSTCTAQSGSAASVGYSCPSGYTLSGSSCSKTTSTSAIPNVAYSCPSGYTLSGSSCTGSTSIAATPTYGCPGGGTVQGSNCTGAPSVIPSAYVYLEGKQIAEPSIVAGAVVTQFVHTDALGSPVAHTNAAGALINRTRFEPFGKTAAGTDPGPGTSLIGFTGHVNDPETGLVYMQQRYYEPIAGRFLSVDPVTTDAASGAHFNRYAYANNNPYRHTDPDGREPRGFLPSTQSLRITGDDPGEANSSADAARRYVQQEAANFYQGARQAIGVALRVYGEALLTAATLGESLAVRGVAEASAAVAAKGGDGDS